MKLLTQLKSKVGFLIAVMIAAIIGGVTTAIVSAAIPDSSGQVNACYNNITKALRVTDPAGSCSLNQTALSWSKGNTNILGNTISITPGSSTPQVLLTIQGLAEVLVTCSTLDSPTTILHNISGETLQLNGSQFLNTDQSVNAGNDLVSKVGMQNPLMARITIVTGHQGLPFNVCRWQSQATVSGS